MHFIWPHRRFSHHFVQLTSVSMIILLLFAVFLGYFHSFLAAGETAFLPQLANALNLAFFNQSGTWNNNEGSDYNMPVSQR